LGGVGALSNPQQARKNLQNSIGAAVAATTAATTTIIRTTVPATVLTSTPVVPVTKAGKNKGGAAASKATGTTKATGTAPTTPTIISTVTTPQGSGQPATIIVQASPQLLQTAQGQRLVTAQVRLPTGVQVPAQPGVPASTVQVRLAAPTATPANLQQQLQQQQQKSLPLQQQPQLQQTVLQHPASAAGSVPAQQQAKKGLSLTVSIQNKPLLLCIFSIDQFRKKLMCKGR
jgi:hypothetical protein